MGEDNPQSTNHFKLSSNRTQNLSSKSLRVRVRVPICMAVLYEFEVFSNWWTQFELKFELILNSSSEFNSNSFGAQLLISNFEFNSNSNFELNLNSKVELKVSSTFEFKKNLTVQILNSFRIQFLNCFIFQVFHFS